MIKTFFAEPVMSTEGKLLGVELLTRFHQADVLVLDSKYYILSMPIEQKRQLLIQQLTEVQIAASWFRDYGLFCSLNVDRLMYGAFKVICIAQYFSQKCRL